VTFATQGANQSRQITITDNAGNSAAFTTPKVNIDTEPPVTTLAGIAAQGSYAKSVTFSLSAADNLSGVASTSYTLDGVSKVYSGAVKIATTGSHTLLYYSVDKAGNTEQSHNIAFAVPASAPSTTATVAGTLGSNEWYTSAVKVTLKASDPLGASYVAKTLYRLDSAASQTYGAPISVTGDGSHTLVYYSVDTAGNTEAAHTLTFKIDATPPVVSWGAASPSPNSSGWNNTTVSIAYSASAVSGIKTEIPGSPIKISTQGTGRTTSVTVTDAAGLTATSISPAANIDATAPVTSETGIVSGKVYAEPITVSLTATDNLSGVASTTYTLDKAAAKAYTGAISIAGSGAHTLVYYSTDKAGNAEKIHTVTLTIAAATATSRLH
jgi:hypothetical protein